MSTEKDLFQNEFEESTMRYKEEYNFFPKRLDR